MGRLRLGVVVVLNSRVENPSRARKGEKERKEKFHSFTSLQLTLVMTSINICCRPVSEWAV